MVARYFFVVTELVFGVGTKYEIGLMCIGMKPGASLTGAVAADEAGTPVFGCYLGEV